MITNWRETEMVKIDVDISWDHFDDQGVNALVDGQDVTHLFAEDIPSPCKADVIKAEGPGGGNPFVSLKFLDEDHAWEWFSNMYMPDNPDVVEEFEGRMVEC